MDDRTPIDPERLLAQSGWLRGLALRLVGDASLGEDVAQETMLAALAAPPPDAATDARLRAWLAGVARNLARFARRGDARRRERERVVARPEGVPGPDETVARAGLFRLVVEAVMELEEPSRTAVLLRYFDGLSSPEIAERTGTAPAAVRKRISRGIETLRARLDAEHDGDRRAWTLALAPWIAKPTVLGVAGAAGLGTGIMTVKKTAAALVIAIAAGVGLWRLALIDPIEPDLDLPGPTLGAGVALVGPPNEPVDLVERVEPMTVEMPGPRATRPVVYEPEPEEELESFVIRGRVVLKGDVPRPRTLEFEPYQTTGCCPPGEEVDRTDRSLLVDENRGIANAIVELGRLEESGPKREEPYEMVQRHCRFEPHVLIVPVDQYVSIRNEDSIQSNARVDGKRNRSWSAMLGHGEASGEHRLPVGEALRVTNDLMPWMEAWIYVSDAERAVKSGADGTFEIHGVVPGRHRLTLWHESLGKAKATVVVKKDGTHEPLVIELRAKASSRSR